MTMPGVNELILILLCPISIMITIVIVTIIVSRNEAKKAMISGGHEEAYHKLAEQAVEAQQKYADEQQKISEGIDDLRNRVAAIERILREVD